RGTGRAGGRARSGCSAVFDLVRARLYPTMARWVEGNPYFLAGALRAYGHRHALDEDDLARALGCPVGALPQLALCRRPVAATFDREVARLAARLRVDAGVLAAIVREAP